MTDYPKHLTALAVSALVTLPALAAPADRPPVEAFFQNAELNAASISPNGRYVVARAASKSTRTSLVLVDLSTMKSTLLARYGNGDVGIVSWLNDKRIMFTVDNIDPVVGDTTSGLYAIDLDGKASTGLAPAGSTRRSFAMNDHLTRPGLAPGVIRGHAPRMSDELFVIVNANDEKKLGLINTRTGAQTAVRAPGGSFSWMLDDNGLRVAVAPDGHMHAMHLLGADRSWRKLASFAPTSAATLVPNAYIDNTLYVQAQNGADRVSVYRYNTERAALEQPALVTSADFDIEGSAISEGKRLLGFRINTDSTIATPRS